MFHNLSAMCSLTHTHVQLSTCAQTIIDKHSVHIYTHTRIYTLIYACIHAQAVLGPRNNHIKPCNKNTHIHVRSSRYVNKHTHLFWKITNTHTHTLTHMYVLIHTKHSAHTHSGLVIMIQSFLIYTHKHFLFVHNLHTVCKNGQNEHATLLI